MRLEDGSGMNFHLPTSSIKMAKQTTYNKQKKKLTFMDIIKGNFLNRDEVKAHYKYFVFIFGLLMVMIYSNHLVNKKIEHVNKLKEETEEYKSRNAYAQSRLIKIRMESELGKEMVQDSLVSLESHPMKLLIKVDSTDDKATK
jgi:hypothetical protein